VVASQLPRHYAPLWLTAPSAWSDERPGVTRYSPYASLRSVGAFMQIQARRYESPDRARTESAMRTRPSTSELATLAPTALGFSMFVAKQVTGPHSAVSSGAKFGLRLKPVIWKSTLGLRAEF